MGCGCGVVGRVVATNTRDSPIKPQHWQEVFDCKIYLPTIYCLEKIKINGNGAGLGPFLTLCLHQSLCREPLDGAGCNAVPIDSLSQQLYKLNAGQDISLDSDRSK